MDTAALILTALLSLYRPPADVRHRIDAHREQIIADATAAADHHHVPVSILLVTAFLETHLGQDRGDSDWGAPLHASTPRVAGNADTSASALALGFNRCHNWLAAVRHYRSGRCDREPPRGYSATYALHVVERVSAQALVSLPISFRTRALARGSPAP